MVGSINKNQKLILVDKILQHFNNNIKGMTFAVWGLAFKPNTDDMRDAPSIVIINKLLEHGAGIKAYDPAAMENAKFHFQDRIEYVEEQYDCLDNAEALLIVTEWNEFRNPDFQIMKNKLKEPLIFDGRNIYNRRITSAQGFTHYSIGKTTVVKGKKLD